MKRRIIQIDEKKCNGCGACVSACHEGAIALVNGKARLMRDDYCDGLGDCLPACPMQAITFVQREAAPYDEQAVLERMRKKGPGCPGVFPQMTTASESACPLAQWPCQLKLVPVDAPYFQGADILIAADCTAVAYAHFHQHLMQGKITLIGCPKLDQYDYSAKLSEIFSLHAIRSVTVAVMEVPCCSAMTASLEKALRISKQSIPWKVVTISRNGALKE